MAQIAVGEFGVSGQQKPARPERAREAGDGLRDGGGRQIDQHVAAHDQIEIAWLGRGRGQVERAETDLRAQAFADLPALLHAREVPVTQPGVHAAKRPIAITSAPRARQRVLVYIGADNLEARSLLRGQQIVEQHRQRVAFLAARTARAPDSQFVGARAQKRRKNLAPQ